MADVSNSFDGGTSGATITTANSGGASGTAFNFVSATTATYTTTAYRGALGGQFASGGVAATSFCEYTTAVGAASTGAVYARLRFRLPVMPPDSTGVRVVVITDSTGSFRAEIRVTNTGAVSIRGPAGTALATFTATYTAGTWWDVGLAVTTFSTTVGVIEGRKYAASGAVEQALTSSANQNTTGAGGTNKCQAGMIRSLANFTVILDDVAWSTSTWPSVAVAAAVGYGPWSGGVTDSAFTAAYVLYGTTSARLVVSAAADLSSPVFSSAAAPDSDGMVKLSVTGLPASALRYYGVEADGVVLAGGRGEVTTFPTAGSPADFSVAFGSCQFDVPSDSTFAAVLARTGVAGRALQLIHMGDMNYRDWGPGTTAADVFAQHMISLGDSSMAPMLAAIPINYLWDNHDWGGDTSDSTAAAGDVVAAAYRKVFPTYTLPATNGRGGHCSWVIGRVRFIQIDTRSYRDPQANAESSSKTMLGAEQKQWLKDRLVDPEPVKIICGQYPWRDDGNGSGRWGSYTDEFNELNTYIAANIPGRVYVIFGDRHYLAADDGTGGVGIPHAGGAPFQQASVAVTGSWSQGSYTIAPSNLQAYGWLDITDDGSQITVDYAGFTSLDGVERVSMTTVFDLTVEGTAAAAGTGALAAAAAATRAGSAAAAGTGALTVSATVIRGTTAAFAGTGALAAEAARSLSTTATAAGDGSLAVSGAAQRNETAGNAGHGSLAANAVVVRAATNAATNGTGSLVAAGTRSRDTTATNAGQGALTVSAVRVRVAAATAAGNGSLAANTSGAVVHTSHASFTGTGALRQLTRVPALTATATVTPGPTGAATVQSLTGTATTL